MSDLVPSHRHLILGGSGFIGKHLAILFAQRGLSVTIASRTAPSCAFPATVAERIRWVKFDLSSAEWETLLQDVDVVHHLAWGTIPATANADPVSDLSINVAATIGLLEAACRKARPPRIVFVSSGGTVYGRVQHIPVSESHPIAPITAYGVSKAAVELYFGYYRSLYGLDCRVARVSNPFGVGQDISRGQGAVTVFLHLALAQKPILIWGDGEIIRDYLHVSDVVEGLANLADTPDLAGQWTYNIASGRGVSLNGIVTELQSQLGRTIEVVRQPGRRFDVPVSILNRTLAQDLLDWSPRLSFSDGIARTIADLRKNAQFSTLG